MRCTATARRPDAQRRPRMPAGRLGGRAARRGAHQGMAGGRAPPAHARPRGGGGQGLHLCLVPQLVLQAPVPAYGLHCGRTVGGPTSSHAARHAGLPRTDRRPGIPRARGARYGLAARDSARAPPGRPAARPPSPILPSAPAAAWRTAFPACRPKGGRGESTACAMFLSGRSTRTPCRDYERHAPPARAGMSQLLFTATSKSPTSWSRTSTRAAQCLAAAASRPIPLHRHAATAVTHGASPA